MRAIDVGEGRHQHNKTDYFRVAFLSAGHLMNDMYGNFMTSLMPYLVLRHDISTTAAGLVLLVYLIGSSVLQPLFGLLADRSGRRIFAIVGPLWVGIAASVINRSNATLTLLLIAGIGGLGTAAFHPQGAAMVDAVSPRNKGRSMAYFSMGGNIGFALGPVAAALVATVGLDWSPVLLIPGAVMTVALARYAPRATGQGHAYSMAEVRRAVHSVWRQLTLVVSVIAIRSAAQYVLIIFLPLYYNLKGFPAELGSYYAFVLSLSGAVGGLLGGYLSDIRGRRWSVVLSLVLAAPLLTVALLLPPLLVWPAIALAGGALLASNSVTVVQGQVLLPGNRGLASGLTLGLGFGLSGVVASAVTTFSDHAGVRNAIFAAPVLALIAAVVACFVRNVPDPETQSLRKIAESTATS